MGLKDMYAYAMKTAQGKFQGTTEERDGKLYFKGTVATQDEKNEIWNAIKTIPTWQKDVVADINSYGLESTECGGTNTLLHDFNDWANLRLASVVTSFTSGGGPARANMSALPAPASCAPIPSYPRGP